MVTAIAEKKRKNSSKSKGEIISFLYKKPKREMLDEIKAAQGGDEAMQ